MEGIGDHIKKLLLILFADNGTVIILRREKLMSAKVFLSGKT